MYLHLYDIITVCLGWKYYINILRMQSRINGDFPEGWRHWTQWDPDCDESLNSESVLVHVDHSLWLFKLLRVFLQVSWDTMATRVHANTSTVAWGVTAWPTTRPVKGSAGAWITASRTTNPCAVQTGSCTKTIVSSTGPPASEGRRLPSCTARSASIKVRAHVTFL